MSQESKVLLPSTFTDQEGRHWAIRFTGRNVRTILEEIGINICDAMEDTRHFFTNLKSHDALAMAWIVLRDESASRNVSMESFLDGLWGQSLLDFNDAFYGALLNFSQGERQLKASATLLAKTRKLAERKMDEASAKLEATTERELEEMMEKALAGEPIESFGKSQESSESTPVT